MKLQKLAAALLAATVPTGAKIIGAFAGIWLKNGKPSSMHTAAMSKSLVCPIWALKAVRTS